MPSVCFLYYGRKSVFWIVLEHFLLQDRSGKAVLT